MQKFIFLYIWLFLATSICADTIVLKESVSVKGLRLRLGDLAEIKGRQDLKNVSLGKVPPPGEHLVYSQEEIFEILAEHGLAPEKIEWQGAESVNVTPQTMAIVPEDLIVLAREFVTLSLPKEIVDFTCSSLHAPKKNILLPAPRKKLKIVPRFIRAGERFGTLPIEVLFQIDGEKVHTERLIFEVRAFAEVLVTCCTVTAKTPVRKSHVKKQRVDITAIAKPIFSWRQLRGKRTRHHVSSSHTLREKDLERMPLVRRGKKVHLIFRSGNLKIRMKVKALENGYLGDTIKTKNLSSRQIIMARVLKSNLVVATNENLSK